MPAQDGGVGKTCSSACKCPTAVGAISCNLRCRQFDLWGNLRHPVILFLLQALIGYGEKNDITWNCAGTLISERFVMSTASCSHSTYS